MKKQAIVKKTVGWCAAVGAAGLVTFAGWGVAFADTSRQSGEARHGMFGTVTAMADGSLTLQTKQGQTIALKTDASTQMRTGSQTSVGLGDLAVGNRVAILAKGEGDAQTALKIMLVPGEPQAEHRVLTVLDVAGNMVVAQDAEGNRVEVVLDHALSSEVRGQLITFVGARSEQSNRFKAHAEVKIGQIIDRLETHAKAAEASVKAEANAQARAKMEQNIADLKTRMEAHMQQHVDLFAEIIAKAPDQAKASLQAALDASLKGYASALQALGETRMDAEAKLMLRNAHGTVAAVDKTAGTITMRMDADATLTVKTSGDTKLMINGKEAALADVSVGDRLSLRYNADTMLASDIKVNTHAEAKGAIKSVNSARGEMVLTMNDGSSLVLRLTPGATVHINGKAAVAVDMKPLSMVMVSYDLKSKEVLFINAEAKGRVEGTIKDVDKAKGTLTVQTSDGADVVLKIAGTTPLKVEGFLFGFVGIQPGMQIKAEYDLATGQALDVDAKAKIQARADGKMNTNVNSDVRIGLGLDLGAKGSASSQASAQSTGGQASASVGVQVKPEAHATAHATVGGTLDSANVTNHHLTVKLQDGSMLMLAIGANTMVTVNGQASAESSLQPGMSVKIMFDGNTKVAVRVDAEGKADVQISGQAAPGTSTSTASGAQGSSGSASTDASAQTSAGAGGASASGNVHVEVRVK